MAANDNSEALDALVALAARLRDTAGAVASRADAAARGAGIGAQRTDADQPGSDRSEGWDSADFGAVIDFARALGESVPDDLRERLSGSTRETLLSIRALIDWYLAREEGRVAADDGEGPGPSDG